MNSDIISAANVTATANRGSATTTKSVEDPTLGKEDFLSLLVAQLKNQDPLNPDDPTEFTAQLAQFSSLEQLFTLNKSMNTLVESYSNSDRLSTLGTIGKEVAYYASTFDFSGEQVEFGYRLDGPATAVNISLQLNGSTIKTIAAEELSAGTHYLTWDGLLDNGQQAPVGEYTIVLNAKATDGESVAVAPVIKSEVTGVDLDGENGGTLLTKAGQIAFNEIIGVYEPGSDSDQQAADNPQEENPGEQSAVDELADTVDTVAETTGTVAQISNDIEEIANTDI